MTYNSKQDKIDSLTEVQSLLDDCFSHLMWLDEDDQNLTSIYWEIKDAKDTVDKYLKELNK